MVDVELTSSRMQSRCFRIWADSLRQYNLKESILQTSVQWFCGSAAVEPVSLLTDSGAAVM